MREHFRHDRVFHAPRAVLWLVILLLALPGLPAEPPALLNYQGVLRDSSNAPLDGSYHMIFRFWSAETGGDEILIDEHPEGHPGEVVVSGGLFNVTLGTGDIFDGSGPGTYASLAEVFRDHSTVWLEVEVHPEVLTPRTRVIAAAYAMNARHLDGNDSTFFLDTSSSGQAKSGSLTLNSPGATALSASSPDGGGYFEDSDDTGFAYVASGDVGIEGWGNTAGGYFRNNLTSTRAYLGLGDRGIEAVGTVAGGWFHNSTESGEARLAYGETGVQGFGELGGYFKHPTSSQVYVAHGTDGIEAYGDDVGGYFCDRQYTSCTAIAYGDLGIEAQGYLAGGHFLDLDSTGEAYLANENRGIWGYGSEAGGYFVDTDGTSEVWVGRNDNGISSYGGLMGGFFEDTDDSAYAYLAVIDHGVEGYGDAAGGYFSDLDSTSAAWVAYDTYKIMGTGTPAFVQNHPEDPSKVVVHHAPEASEVGVYTRGSARLENGRASISLDETFSWVANPDLGLTAHLTPRENRELLAVESVTTKELVVRGDEGSNTAFDYMVWGLRIGFEELAPVQPKREEAYIPSMKSHRDLYAEEGGLRRFNSLERFKEMSAQLGGVQGYDPDLTAARELRDAIQEYDPDLHGIVHEKVVADRREVNRKSSSEDPRPQPDLKTGIDTEVPVETPVVDRQATDILFPVGEAVVPGDLLVLDPDHPGQLRRACSPADPAVVGIVAGEASDFGGLLQAPVVGVGFAIARVDAGYGAVRAGDLLTSSPTPGHAMVAMDPLPGAVIGKAMEPLEYGTGLVRVLVMPR